MTREEYLKFNSWQELLEDRRTTDDTVARCENIYMKWLLQRHIPTIVPKERAA